MKIELVGTDVPVQFVVWTGRVQIVLRTYSADYGLQRVDFSELWPSPMDVRCRSVLDMRNRQRMSVGF